MNTRISKTQNHGSGLLVRRQPAGRRHRLRRGSSTPCKKEGGYLAGAEEKAQARGGRCGTPRGVARIDTVARAAGVIAAEGRLRAARRQDLHHRQGRQDRQRRTASRAKSCRPVLAIFKYQRVRHVLRDGVGDLRGGRQGPLGRHRVVRRRAHSPAGVDGAGQPDHGAPAERARQRRFVHQRDAADGQSGLRHLGRQHHQREHQRQALHEHDLGEPALSRRTSRTSRSCSASSTTSRSDQRRFAVRGSEVDVQFPTRRLGQPCPNLER